MKWEKSAHNKVTYIARNPEPTFSQYLMYILSVILSCFSYQLMTRARGKDEEERGDA
jgi:hypothetical protein